MEEGNNNNNNNNNNNGNNNNNRNGNWYVFLGRVWQSVIILRLC